MDILEYALSQRIGGADGEIVEALCDEVARLRAAIAWALGEGADENGNWFKPDKDEPRRPDGNPIARYWWRGNLRRMIAPNAALRPRAEGESSLEGTVRTGG